MLDSSIRTKIVPHLDAFGHVMARRGITPIALTGVGFGLGVAACVAVATNHWWIGLVLWLANRAADGLDGAVARAIGPTEVGGFLDIMADFAIYGGIVVALGVAEPDLRLPALVTFLCYYLSGSSFLAWSSLSERLGIGTGDGRSLRFPAGLAEGTETIVAMCVVLVFRDIAVIVLWVWAAMVAVTVVQRIVFVSRHLRDDQPDQEAKGPVG